MNKEKLQSLLQQYLSNTIAPEDCRELLSYLSQAQLDDLPEDIDLQLLLDEEGPVFPEARAERVLQLIKEDPRFEQEQELVLQQHKRSSISRLYHSTWLRIAAILVIVSSFSIYFYSRTKDAHYSSSQRVIVPGGKKAVLTLSNGQKIVLDDKKDGKIAEIGNLRIKKEENGRLIIEALGTENTASADEQTKYNVIETPKGGEYQVLLPDGSIVWLNSATSLRFPVSFAANKREVDLRGEAYFEVAKDKRRPFRVKAMGSVIEVLGTHFNIAAYHDDATLTTTLVEGSVSVSDQGKSVVIKPGQKASIASSGGGIIVEEANVREALAWKNGYFIFRNENIKSIMRKISRWYDVDVIYVGDVDDQRFGGTYYRSKSIGELLGHLEKLGPLRFKIEGRTITVRK